MSPLIQSGAKRRSSATAARGKSLSQSKGRSAGKKKPKSGRAAALGRVPGSKKIVATLLPGFSRQLAAMLSAGMPIVAALDALEDQSDNPNFKKVITRVRASIENGAALSESLRFFPSVFDTLYCNMVKGGEQGGKLAETIDRLAGFLEASAKLRRKVKSAMMYPVIVLCISLGIALGMITFVVPTFGEMFSDFGADLPAPTQFLLDLSGLIKRYGVYVVVIFVVSIVMFKKWKATNAGAYAINSFVLRAPVFGELNKKVASARFSRTFAQLIRSGVPILSALEIVSGATGSEVAQRVVLEARGAVEKGEPLSSAMLTQTVFPKMLVRMLQAGEKTGRIDEMMDNIAAFYEDEVDTMLDGLTSLLEPLLIVFLGVIIGGIVLCMFLPIFKMGEIVGSA